MYFLHGYRNLYEVSVFMVTGQLADTPTRGLPTRGLDKSWTGQLAVSQMPPKRTRNPAIAEGPRDAGVPVEIW